MIERIHAAYPPKEQAVCITTLFHPVFHVYDPLSLAGDEATERLPSTYRLGPDKEDRELTVQNETGQPVHLVAIDCCLFTSDDPSRCDCALVQDATIHFVEFKHGNYRRRTDRIKDCIPQLANSINDFYANGILAARQAVLAIACVGFTEEFPPRTASLEAHQARLNLLVSVDVLVELRVTDTTLFAPSAAAEAQ
ncbi:hypothetical protein E4631_09270 [Hymenobacter sp. UV11]|uniref:hypothetical protein n=1 Tax=Hymenobacter sp. UV11 TaxID=1849735 RepID=UPI001061773A|nr:hypothetical protein [Hymenobacter sp. UV11]TDN39750.1 hypothetical protein A8B98_17410 [Hymenobacter sp. UV11]TFZ67131.1 hypothetical protein E4631_09270 [Hymenobacter sp. UV11]